MAALEVIDMAKTAHGWKRDDSFGAEVMDTIKIKAELARGCVGDDFGQKHLRCSQR